MTAISETTVRHQFSLAQYFICLRGIVWREALRFIHQRERFISALVRPLVWLFIFAAGFRQVGAKRGRIGHPVPGVSVRITTEVSPTADAMVAACSASPTPPGPACSTWTAC